LSDGGTSDDERIAYAVRRCLSRAPNVEEASVLHDFVNAQKQRFAKTGADPWALLADDDKAKRKLSAHMPAGATPAELAAWTALSRVVLNLDETITKE
jgi:hypothetical protein